jgi:hypothetical protein
MSQVSRAPAKAESNAMISTKMPGGKRLMVHPIIPQMARRVYRIQQLRGFCLAKIGV